MRRDVSSTQPASDSIPLVWTWDSSCRLNCLSFYQPCLNQSPTSVTTAFSPLRLLQPSMDTSPSFYSNGNAKGQRWPSNAQAASRSPLSVLQTWMRLTTHLPWNAFLQRAPWYSTLNSHHAYDWFCPSFKTHVSMGTTTMENGMEVPQKSKYREFPSWLGTMRLWVRSLALLSGLKICRCCELWCSLQMWLGSHDALALAQAGGYSSTPSLGTSICCGSGPGKGKKTKK